MKKEELKKILTDYERSVVFDSFRDLVAPDETKTVYKHISEAENVDDFVEKILSDENLVGKQIYCVLLTTRRPARVWMTIRKTLGDRVFKTWSESGAVRVGVNGFHALFGNGRGDGETRVAVIEQSDDVAWVRNLMKFSGSFDGENIDICVEDGSNAPALTISGRYGIYVYDGIVLFEKWD